MMFNIVTQPLRVKWQNLNILYHLETELESLLICLITSIQWPDVTFQSGSLLRCYKLSNWKGEQEVKG